MRGSPATAMAVVVVLAVSGLAVAQQPPAATPAPAAPPAPAAAPAATSTIPIIYVDAMRIQLDGRAEYTGNVKMEFLVQGADPKLVSVDVIPKMDSDEIARDLYKQLTLAAGTKFKVKQGGDRVTIQKADKKGPNFSLKITNQTVLGVSFLIAKD